ncbi:MAG: glyoxalase [Candidatus Marinimicrobia bacterium]|nr:glyoxalase [Candidatus Neomarinimicrobiota bacterium]|tara:strand:+ start:553 stop:978 length:426 start_codon:yes stop_codon:yes gene_type:complete
MNKDLRPFHLAFPVLNINETIQWYTNILGCKIGRQDKRWVDFNFHGHQISAHLVDQEIKFKNINIVDGENIPCRHFGIILSQAEWNKLSKELILKKINFIIKPNTRFKGKKGEQSTFFIKDPSGNVLEFKSFKNDKMIFDN